MGIEENLPPSEGNQVQNSPRHRTSTKYIASTVAGLIGVSVGTFGGNYYLENFYNVHDGVRYESFDPSFLGGLGEKLGITLGSAAVVGILAFYLTKKAFERKGRV